MAGCNRCATTSAEGCDEPARMWMGQGLYWWPQSAQSTPPDNGWIFGLEDRYFPPEEEEKEKEEEEEEEEVDDGLTDEFINFLEKRLTLIDSCAQSLSQCEGIQGLEGSTLEPLEPVAPVRRKRLSRSQSLQPVRTQQRRGEMQHETVQNAHPPAAALGHQHGGSAGIDLIQRIKRWARSGAAWRFRRAFRKGHYSTRQLAANPPVHLTQLRFPSFEMICTECHQTDPSLIVIYYFYY